MKIVTKEQILEKEYSKHIYYTYFVVRYTSDLHLPFLNDGVKCFDIIIFWC